MKIALNSLLRVIDPERGPVTKPQIRAAIRHARSMHEEAQNSRLIMDRREAEPADVGEVSEHILNIELAWCLITEILEDRLENHRSLAGQIAGS